jgi:phenolic acid decarboxylase
MPLSDIVDKNLVYTYDDGRKYQFWLKSPTRIVYRILAGLMGGKYNYQTCTVQEIRPGEIFQISFLEGQSTLSLYVHCS